MSRSRTYIGVRDGVTGYGKVLVRIVADGRAHGDYDLPHIVKHSPTGMEWGSGGGSGLADLANSILSDATEVKGVSPMLYQAFKAEVISRLDESGFEVGHAFVMDWLNRRWANMDEAAIKADFMAA